MALAGAAPGSEPPSDVALQAGGTEARGRPSSSPSSSGFDRRPGMGRDGPTDKTRDMQNALTGAAHDHSGDARWDDGRR